MKHHSQRSKRPPSRTLAPRILAALTAGAVTLGALPCAYAANKFIVTSSVTEDTEVEYGVVGNIDGAPATITVGRVGYGGTPVIYTKDGYGNAVEWRNAFGTFGESNTVNATFDVRGGRAILRSGSLMGFFGAFGGVLNGGRAHVEGNSAEVRVVRSLGTGQPASLWRGESTAATHMRKSCTAHRQGQRRCAIPLQ